MKNTKDVKKIISLHFGELEVSQEYIFHFPNGVLGFEYLRDFVLISEEETIPFKWLVSVEEPAIGFPILSPWLIELEYSPGKNYNLDKLVFLCIVTLEDENHQMTINLKAPIILDTEKSIGEQIILTSDKYSTNHVIIKK